MDLNKLRVDVPNPVSSSSSWRRRKLGRFLKGPVPWNWLSAAAHLSGKALHVGVVLWFVSGVKRSRIFPLPLKHLAEAGISRQAAYRALDRMEAAGLVRVEKVIGRKTVVEILKRPDA